MPEPDDLISPAIYAMMTAVKAEVTGIGRCFETSDATPVPDGITLEGGKPAAFCLGPLDWEYDQDNGYAESFTDEGVVRDRYRVAIILLHGTFQNKGFGLLQRKARPYGRRIRRVVRKHETLDDTCWRARPDRGRLGPYEWGKVLYLATQVNVYIEFEDQAIEED